MLPTSTRREGDGRCSHPLPWKKYPHLVDVSGGKERIPSQFQPAQIYGFIRGIMLGCDNAAAEYILHSITWCMY